MVESKAKKHLDCVIEAVKENPFRPQTELLAEFMDAVLDYWNEEIAGAIELTDGTCVTIQPIIDREYPV